MILLQPYGSQGVECGSSNLIGPQNLIGNGTIRRCDFDGMSMALLEEVYLCEAFFDVSYA